MALRILFMCLCILVLPLLQAQNNDDGREKNVRTGGKSKFVHGISLMLYFVPNLFSTKLAVEPFSMLTFKTWVPHCLYCKSVG